MGNPIQYHNTDNKGGFVKRLQYAPPGRTQRGVNDRLGVTVLFHHYWLLWSFASLSLANGLLCLQIVMVLVNRGLSDASVNWLDVQ